MTSKLKGWVISRRKSKNITCLLRPEGDNVAEVYGGIYSPAFLPMEILMGIQLGDKFDILCTDGLNYMCKIAKILNNGKVQIHFENWGSRYDCVENLDSLYLAHYRQHSAEDGISTSNQYVLPTMKPTPKTTTKSKPGRKPHPKSKTILSSSSPSPSSLSSSIKVKSRQSTSGRRLVRGRGRPRKHPLESDPIQASIQAIKNKGSRNNSSEYAFYYEDSQDDKENDNGGDDDDDDEIESVRSRMNEDYPLEYSQNYSDDYPADEDLDLVFRESSDRFGSENGFSSLTDTITNGKCNDDIKNYEYDNPDDEKRGSSSNNRTYNHRLFDTTSTTSAVSTLDVMTTAATNNSNDYNDYNDYNDGNDYIDHDEHIDDNETESIEPGVDDETMNDCLTVDEINEQICRLREARDKIDNALDSLLNLLLEKRARTMNGGTGVITSATATVITV